MQNVKPGCNFHFLWLPQFLFWSIGKYVNGKAKLSNLEQYSVLEICDENSQNTNLAKTHSGVFFKGNFCNSVLLKCNIYTG